MRRRLSNKTLRTGLFYFSNTKRYIAHQSKCEDEICTLCVRMKEKYYDLAYQAARDKAREMLNKLRRKEQLDKIYNKFETTTDAIVPTDFNYQANYVNSAIEKK
ncbi:unnamed protein product [Oikopleura dioica]|uniref:Uncharacterized protein n=1 Tax=Oikopleura dioica TaxID=34765 RepID=E4Z0E3_OIKDI|nr:unnamed protein product [Oikopleura dioica]